MQKKIQFVAENGSVFFECAPAEARVAVKAVEAFRTLQEETLEEQSLRRQNERAKSLAKAAPISGTKTYDGNRMSAMIVSDLFLGIEDDGHNVTHVLMNAIRYADLRCWDRDCIDTEHVMWKLRAGSFAYIWGATVVVTKDLPNDEVALVSDKTATKDQRGDKVLRWKLALTGKKLPPSSKEEQTMEILLARLTAIEGLLKNR